MTEVKEANPEETTQSQSPGKKAAREGGKRRSFLKPTTGLRMKEVSFMGSYENITSHMVSPLKREVPEFDEGNAKLESDWFVCVTLPPTLDPEVENKKLRCPGESVQSLQPPPHKKSRAVCQNFLRGLCSRGPLCPFRHAVLRPGLSPTVTPEMLSPYSARLAGLVVPKKILERVLASERFELIDMLKGLYVGKQVGVGLKFGDPIVRLMRIDRVVPCFSPYGVLQTKYGIVLSTDGKAETEVVAKFDEIVNPVFEAIPFLVSKYEKKLSKLGIELPAEETLNELRQRIMFIHEELGGH